MPQTYTESPTSALNTNMELQLGIWLGGEDAHTCVRVAPDTHRLQCAAPASTVPQFADWITQHTDLEYGRTRHISGAPHGTQQAKYLSASSQYESVG